MRAVRASDDCAYVDGGRSEAYCCSRVNYDRDHGSGPHRSGSAACLGNDHGACHSIFWSERNAALCKR